MKISESIIYVGVNDHDVDLFEGQYVVLSGMAYNSYVILDEKIAVMDTVDAHFTHEWLDNVQKALNGRTPDYLVVQHMEPDHSANVLNFKKVYPETKIVASEKAFTMMKNFFGEAGEDFSKNGVVVKEGDYLNLGYHVLNFVTAPMVHWPEVILTYESTEKVLFSADAFGKFGANDITEPWDDEARRYYIGIVGKYGAQVQSVLKKAASLDIKTICPLHGPVLSENLAKYLKLYDVWSSYEAEVDGVLIAYTSVYGNTKSAVEMLKEKLIEAGCPNVEAIDLARSDMSFATAEAFKYSKLVLATTTYNADIFPAMREFINHLTERNYSNRTVAFIENGSWAPLAAKVMRGMFEKSKNLTFAENGVRIISALSAESKEQISALATELCREYIALKDRNSEKNDLTSLNNLGYGLYAVTSNDGKKDNALIVNTIMQVTSSPNRVAVVINKQNYSHHVIKQTGKLNVNCLTVETPFKIFEKFGFVSGRNVDKLAGVDFKRSDNGLAILTKYSNSFISLKVEDYSDLGTHGMFVCSVSAAKVLSDKPTMSYAYYHENVKPKPEIQGKKGYVCKICGYVYEGELPEDYVCPLCKHGAVDFEKIV